LVNHLKNQTQLSIISLDFSIQKIKKRKNEYAGLLTMPICKEEVGKFIKGFEGHTEYLEEKFDRKLSMLLYSQKISSLTFDKTYKNLKMLKKKFLNLK